MSKTNRPNPAAERAVKRVRYLILASLAAVVLGVLAVGIDYSTTDGAGSFVADEDYRVYEDAPAREPGTPITVREVFSYACIHCRNFDPLIETWRKAQPADVDFERLPATFSPGWYLLGQTYYALLETGALERNHERLFRAIHDTGRVFTSIEALADFVDGFGVTREAFLAAAKGPDVTRKMREADRMQREIGLTGVPTLLVDGRYVIGMGSGRKGALDIADHLINEIRSADQSAARSSAADSTVEEAAEAASGT